MGLLGSIINIIGKGVAKGVSDIVEKKVAEVVKPAATKFAEKQAELIENATKNIETANESMKQAGESLNQAGDSINEAVEQNPESFRMAMEILRTSAEKAAAEGKLELEEKELTDEEVMAKLETLLPDFPKWDCGGNHFSIEEEDIDGQHFIRFYASAAEMSWIAYKTKLIANGFRMKYRQDTATWYKEVEGRYPAVHLFHIDYDACEMQLVFYYETQKDIEEAAKL